MNFQVEEKIIKNFIIKNMQDRFLYELSKKEKRKKFLSRFAHNIDKYLVKQYIYLQGNKLMENDIDVKINLLSCNMQNCYVISNYHDGKEMSIKLALEECFNSISEFIIIVNENIVFIKEETEYGSSMKYLLYKK